MCYNTNTPRASIIMQVKALYPKCKKPHTDWSLVALAAVEPNADVLLAGLPNGRTLEVLASVRSSSSSGKNSEATGARLDGPNHFTLFHTLDYSRTAALNRLVQARRSSKRISLSMSGYVGKIPSVAAHQKNPVTPPLLTLLLLFLQMASAEVVLLMLPGQEAAAKDALAAAHAEFAARPALGLMSFGHGYLLADGGSGKNPSSNDE
jgi:hypothetical protein